MPDKSTQECAAMVMGTIPLVMRSVGAEMKKRRSSDFTVRQFHTLMIVKHEESPSISLVAEHLGATLSAASKLADGLVQCGYLTRETDSRDRRRIILALTESGKAELESAHMDALAYVGEILEKLSPSECAMIKLGMELLRSVFAPALAAKPKSDTRKEGRAP